jgi:hypothetical protein
LFRATDLVQKVSEKWYNLLKNRYNPDLIIATTFLDPVLNVPKYNPNIIENSVLKRKTCYYPL